MNIDKVNEVLAKACSVECNEQTPFIEALSTFYYKGRNYNFRFTIQDPRCREVCIEWYLKTKKVDISIDHIGNQYRIHVDNRFGKHISTDIRDTLNAVWVACLTAIAEDMGE
jgi:hypothetical protein